MNVGNVDIAPSMLAAAGVAPALKYPFDGRPFLNAAGLTTGTRTEEYLEYFVDDNRSIPDWSSVRTPTYQYIEYYQSKSDTVIYREYYDMANDPEQLVNLMADGNATNDPDVSTLHDRLLQYRHCSGTTGPKACS
jgi:arylsulfatase A-like enzyme